MPISNRQLDDLAQNNDITVVRPDRKTISLLTGDGQELFSASSGAKVSNAIKAIHAHISPTSTAVAPGSRIPVTTWMGEFGDGSTSLERNYDREIPLERAVRDPVSGTRLLAMLDDGGFLDTALRELVGSAFASQDGDDYGWAISPTTERNRLLNPKTEEILHALCDRLIGGRSLKPAMHRMLGMGDCFLSVGIDRSATGEWQINRLKYLPTFEVFRVEPEVVDLNGGVHTDLYFEQRRFLSDEDSIIIEPHSLIHFRFDYRGGLYGRSLFAGAACYNLWVGLKEAESDLRAASRSIGATPLKHIFPPNYSPEQKKAYRDLITRKRQEEGLLTDFYISSPGNVEGVFGLNDGIKNLVQAIEYYRKQLATHSRIPAYLLNVEQRGARDIAQQPALAFMRLVNSIRQDFTEGLKKLCTLELLLHRINPELPENQFKIVWPKITIDAFENPNAGEHDLFPDTEPTSTQEESLEEP